MDDDDDAGPVIVNGRPFWGPDGNPRDIVDSGDVAIILSVMEQDNGTPAQYVELVNAKALISLGASAGDPSPRSRATRLTTDIANVLNAIDVPIPFSFDDDHIGTQQFFFIGGFGGWQHELTSAREFPAAPGTSPTSWYSTSRTSSTLPMSAPMIKSSSVSSSCGSTGITPGITAARAPVASR
jgi:hypothetical protein